MAKITLTPLPKENESPVKTGETPISGIGKITPAEFLLEKAESSDCKLYGIVDSARNDEVFRYLIIGNVKYKSLFEGTMDVQSFGVSGFLVECEKESPLFQWMTTEGWGNSSCVFFTSKLSFEELFSHFQQFNRVYLEEDKVVLFRYYDPRVLRTYLPSCNREEVEAFFGGVEHFYLESEDPETLNVIRKSTGEGSEILVISGFKIKLKLNID